MTKQTTSAGKIFRKRRNQIDETMTPDVAYGIGWSDQSYHGIKFRREIIASKCPELLPDYDSGYNEARRTARKSGNGSPDFLRYQREFDEREEERGDDE